MTCLDTCKPTLEAAEEVPRKANRGKSFAPTALSGKPVDLCSAELLSDEQRAMLTEIEAMQGSQGFDFVIVCCSNLAAENFWQERLEATVEEVTGCKATTVLAVHEDWNGGAGNGLGTLYAFTKACAKAQEIGLDLLAKMKAGAAVALYHTAGKGTRLAPLPGAENNNKPGVKLSALVKVGGEHRPLTVLEAVMRQTSSYARVRDGRCSVFWGDQVFVPSCGVQRTDKHADILAALRPMPTKEEWEAEALHQYGLIAVSEDGSALQLEKVTYDVAVQYLPANVKSVGTSLGSFSLSAAFMAALLDEFAPELEAKTACLDSDPHFWMPVTLARQDYLDVMAKKGTAAEEAGAHFDRMAAFRARFAASDEALLGCVDVGRAAYWWDYGRLELYMTNSLFVTETSASAAALRAFLRLDLPGTPGDGRQQLNTLPPTVEVDASAVVLNSKVTSGKVGPKCVLVNVNAPSVDLEGCVLINVTSTRPIVGRNGLLYNVVEEGDAHSEGGPLACDAVRADVFMPGGIKHTMLSTLDTDGGTAWKTKLDANPHSFESIYKANQPLDVRACTVEADGAHKRVRDALWAN